VRYEDDEGRWVHWSTVDLWSDKRSSTPDDLSEEEVDETEPIAVDWKRFTRRTARVEVSFPSPVTVATLKQESVELQRSLQSRAADGLRYWDVRLSCSFYAPDPHERFERAEVRLTLTALRAKAFAASADMDDPIDQAVMRACLASEQEAIDTPDRHDITPVRDVLNPRRDPSAPVAWSMQPDERAARTPTTAQHYKIGADVKFVTASVEHEVTQPAPVLIRAYNLGTSEPWWALGGRRQALDGNYELAVIVQGRRAQVAQVDVTMNATIVKRRRLRRPLRRTVKGAAGVMTWLLPENEFARVQEELE
jgi:hypothetical protein